MHRPRTAIRSVADNSDDSVQGQTHKRLAVAAGRLYRDRCTSATMTSATTSLLAIAMTLTTGACGHPDRQLPHWVYGYCHTLERQLKDAADRYRQRGAELEANQALTSEQREQIEFDLSMNSVGVSEDVRRARVSDFNDRALFCLTVHRLDDQQLENLEVRLQTVRESLYGAVMSGKMPTAAKTADLLEQFHALAQEIDAAPLKN
jgi:hypothetical protein